MFIMPRARCGLPHTWDGQRWDGVACDVSPAPVEGWLVAGDGREWVARRSGWYYASRVYARQDWMNGLK